MTLRSSRATGAALDKVCNCGVRLVTIHTKLVGALDAIILFSIALVGIAMLAVLLDPYGPSEQLVRQGTVTIQQLAEVDSVTRHM